MLADLCTYLSALPKLSRHFIFLGFFGYNMNEGVALVIYRTKNYIKITTTCPTNVFCTKLQLVRLNNCTAQSHTNCTVEILSTADFAVAHTITFFYKNQLIIINIFTTKQEVERKLKKQKRVLSLNYRANTYRTSFIKGHRHSSKIMFWTFRLSYKNCIKNHFSLKPQGMATN